MIFLGKPNELLYGDETWDLMMLVQYPSRAKFLEMANNPEYTSTRATRKAAEKAVLYATDQIRFRTVFPKLPKMNGGLTMAEYAKGLLKPMVFDFMYGGRSRRRTMIMFLHGFPEFWYAWRKQISYFADRGYLVVAPIRGVTI